MFSTIPYYRRHLHQFICHQILSCHRPFFSWKMKKKETLFLQSTFSTLLTQDSSLFYTQKKNLGFLQVKNLVHMHTVILVNFYWKNCDVGSQPPISIYWTTQILVLPHTNNSFHITHIGGILTRKMGNVIGIQFSCDAIFSRCLNSIKQHI